MTTAEWIDELRAISVAELAERIRALEETFGVSAYPTSPPSVEVGHDAGEETEEQTVFAVRLVEYGAAKIQVIKVVRAATGLGLKEAKDVVDRAPIVVVEGLDRERADAFVKELAGAGGKAELV